MKLNAPIRYSAATAVLAALLNAPPAYAEDAKSNAPRRLTISYRQKEIGSVIKSLAAEHQLPLQWSYVPGAKVDLDLKDATLQDVVVALTRTGACRPAAHVVGPRINFEPANSAPLEVVKLADGGKLLVVSMSTSASREIESGIRRSEMAFTALYVPDYADSPLAIAAGMDVTEVRFVGGVTPLIPRSTNWNTHHLSLQPAVWDAEARIDQLPNSDPIASVKATLRRLRLIESVDLELDLTQAEIKAEAKGVSAVALLGNSDADAIRLTLSGQPIVKVREGLFALLRQGGVTAVGDDAKPIDIDIDEFNQGNDLGIRLRLGQRDQKAGRSIAKIRIRVPLKAKVELLDVEVHPSQWGRNP